MKVKLVAARLEQEQLEKLLDLAAAAHGGNISAALRRLIDQLPKREERKEHLKSESETVHV